MCSDCGSPSWGFLPVRARRGWEKGVRGLQWGRCLGAAKAGLPGRGAGGSVTWGLGPQYGTAQEIRVGLVLGFLLTLLLRESCPASPERLLHQGPPHHPWVEVRV